MGDRNGARESGPRRSSPRAGLRRARRPVADAVRRENARRRQDVGSQTRLGRCGRCRSRCQTSRPMPRGMPISKTAGRFAPIISGDDEPQPGGRRRAGRAAGAALSNLAATVRRLLSTPRRKSAACSPASGSPACKSRPFRVFYHRDRDEYVEALAPAPAADRRNARHLFRHESRSPLLRRRRRSDDARATLYHEAVHQLFQESKPAAEANR